MLQHKKYLLKTLELAEKRLGFCAPNPAVGAVVVKEDDILGEGFHWGCGHPHAEVEAIRAAGDAAKGATLYVSLEPCCHFGRTPPCTDLIKTAGIKAVFYAFQDPNPIVSGRCAGLLNEAGIVCAQVTLVEIDAFYLPYAYWTKNKKPYVIAKLALSADHKIAGENNEAIKISGKECDALTHHYRLHSDAILTTINTILYDNPQLNARIDNTTYTKPIYILDSQARLPLHATIFNTAQSITLFCAKKSAQTETLEKRGVRCIVVPQNSDGLDLNAVLNTIGEDGVHRLWVEAGAQCFQSFLKQQLLNRAILYISKNKLGSDAVGIAFDVTDLSKNAAQYQCGSDWVIDRQF